MRVVTTTLDGGMRGPRGQHRDSVDNETLHTENMLHERGAVLRNRPALKDLPGEVTLLPRDRVIPFEWEGNRYFFIYDPNYGFEWRPERYVSRDRTTHRYFTILSGDNSPDSTAYSAIDLALDYGFANFDKRTLWGILKNYLPDGIRLGDTTESDISIMNAGVYLLMAKTSMLQWNLNDYYGYKSYYMLSLLQFFAKNVFYIFDTPGAIVKNTTDQTNYDPGDHIRPLYPVVDEKFLWQRFLVKDEDGRVVGNGVHRGLPLSHNVGTSPAQSFTDYDRIRETIYDDNGVLGTEASTARYEISEGVSNFVLSDPTGQMPPLVLESSRGKTTFRISEMNTRYAFTGLTRRYIPSFLTKEEVPLYDAWNLSTNPVLSSPALGAPDFGFYTSSHTNLSGGLTGSVNDFSAAKLRAASISLGHRSRWVGELESYLENNVEVLFLRSYRESRLPEDTFSSDSLPLPVNNSPGDSLTGSSGGQGPASGFATWRDTVVQDTDSTLYDVGPGVVRMRYSLDNASANSVNDGFSPQANPFYEQCPVIAYRSERVRGLENNGVYTKTRTNAELSDFLRILYGVKGGTIAWSVFNFTSEVWIYRITITTDGEFDRESRDTIAIVSLDTFNSYRTFEVDPEQASKTLNSFFYANPTFSTSKVKVTEEREGITHMDGTDGTPENPVEITVPIGFDIRAHTAGSDNNDLIPEVTLPAIRSAPIEPELFYYDQFIGNPVYGFSPGSWFTRVLAEGNRYSFTNAAEIAEWIFVTSTTSRDRSILGPEQGSFGFSALERVTADPTNPISEYGYTQALTDEGGINVLWATSQEGQIIIGTTKGKLTLAGLDLASLTNGVLDVSDTPSETPPIIIRGVLYQVMSDRRQIYAIEGSEERRRNTWRSISSPITDFLMEDPVKDLTGLADTGRILALTDGGRLYIGQITPQGDVRWGELTFPQGPVDSMGRIRQTLYLDIGNRLYVFEPNLVEDIEVGAKLSLTLKHPSSYLKGEYDKGLSDMNTCKYTKGTLLGSFHSGGAAREVGIGAYTKEVLAGNLRSIRSREFSQVNLQHIHDGLKFTFTARRIEIDEVHMEIRG